jgi:imidazolonepropionase-like amidohydrolase
VTVGTRADLLILSSNPLTDLGALRSPANIVRLGRIYSTAQLDSIRRAN